MALPGTRAPGPPWDVLPALTPRPPSSATAAPVTGARPRRQSRCCGRLSTASGKIARFRKLWIRVLAPPPLRVIYPLGNRAAICSLRKSRRTRSVRGHARIRARHRRRHPHHMSLPHGGRRPRLQEPWKSRRGRWQEGPSSQCEPGPGPEPSVLLQASCRPAMHSDVQPHQHFAKCQLEQGTLMGCCCCQPSDFDIFRPARARWSFICMWRNPENAGRTCRTIHFAIMLLRITQAWELRATSSPRPKAASSVSPDEGHPSCDGTPSPEAGQLPL